MIYYGFKFENVGASPSKINPLVGTWIGLVATIMFLIIAAKAGGFKGALEPEGVGILGYIGVAWFMNYLAIEYAMAKFILVYFSGVVAFVAFIFLFWFYVFDRSLLFHLVSLFVFNSGIFLFGINEQTSLIGEDSKR